MTRYVGTDGGFTEGTEYLSVPAPHARGGNLETLRTLRTDRQPSMPVILDWHTHKIGPPARCRICRRDALMRDAEGKPCHKVCAEGRARP